MPIRYKSVKRAQPGVAGGGEKKYYAAPVMDGELNLDGLTTAIEKICTVSGADIRAVLYALVDVTIDRLGDSKIIRLGDLGSVRVTLSSNGVEKEEDVKSTIIRKAGVIFTPGPRIKLTLEHVKYMKV
ncbi:MAG: DNA-binding protein [Tannerella sp.]|jgi:predicted histone-like DNA-binding protein|nr:DNA-binding protein [Tannerella sp.]